MRKLPWFVLLCISGAGSLFAADDAPAWVKEAAAQSIPAFPAKVSSVVLLQEEAMTVEADGRRVMRERGAVKVLQSNGDELEAYRTYNTRTGRIRSFQGWLISPAGKTFSFPQKNILDVALSKSYVYDEARAKVLASGKAAQGSIFAWEIIEEEKTVFTQSSFGFQGRSPVLLSRYSLTLPAGWEMKASVFNRDNLEPQITGNTYNWELHNLPMIEDESYSLPVSGVAPRLAVSYFPPADNAAGLVGLKDWSSVSSWLSTLVDPPAHVTEKIRAKATQLTAGLDGDLAKIRAIAEFVQKTNYVAISFNITRGGGYTPHDSDEVLSRNYGDCKDKATLMRSLLKAIGTEAYLTAITADDRNYVQSEWASPMQFNHAIIAIAVPASVVAPTILENTPLGRLLIFDPTDSITPLGDLPVDEQGSHALVVAEARGILLTMPRLSAEASRIDSVVNGTLGLDGQVAAKLDRQYFGQAGAFVRGIEQLQGTPELKQRFERMLARRVAGMSLTTMAVNTHPLENMVLVNLDVRAGQLGQAQGPLLVVRPGLLSSGGEYFLPATNRSTPIALSADLRHESIRIKLPAGFKPDEIPEAQKIDSPYGTLQARWSVENGDIVMEETLTIRETLAQAAEYGKVRDFFERVAGAHSAPVVLVKQ